jgi:hypothetical protein
LSFGEISTWLIDWDYSYKVVVKNKQIQLLVDMNSVEQELDIADHNNEVTIIENVTPGNSTANVTNDYYNNILGWVMLIAFVIITFVPVIIFVFIPNNIG